MAQPDQADPRIYGGVVLSTDTPPVFLPNTGVPEAVAPTPVPFAEASAAGTYALAAGVASNAAANRPVATASQSMAEAFRSTSPFKVWEWINEPTHAPRAGYSPNSQMSLLTFTPTDDEEKWLKSSNREEQWQYRADRIKELRESQRIMGDHPVLSTIVSVADFGYLGLDLAGLGAAHAAAIALRVGRGTQRTIAGGTAFGGAMALGRVEQEVTPISDGAIVLNALVNGAAGAVAYRAGKFEAVDPTYPTDDLTRAANDLRSTIPEPVVQGVREEASQLTVLRREPTTPSVPSAATVPPTVDTPVAAVPTQLPRDLAQAAPRYSFGSKQFELEFASDFDRAAYITAQDTPSRRDADFMRFAMATSGMSEAQVRTHGRAVRDSIKGQASSAEAGALRIEATPRGVSNAPEYDTRGMFDMDRRLSYPSARTIYGGNALDSIAGAGGDFAELAGVLRGAGGSMLDDLPIKQMRAGGSQRPYYLAAEHAIYVPEHMLLNPTLGDNARVIVHEVAHGLTVQKIHYGLLNPESAHGKLVAQLEDLRRTVVAEMERMGNKNVTSEYLSGDITEFAAGLFWGGSDFTSQLAKIPVRGAVNALSQMVQVVRKMLGMTSDRESVLTRALSITDELVASPLDVTTAAGRTVSFAPKAGPDVAAQIVKNEESYAKRVGDTIAWNLHKTLSGFSPKFKEIADILVDNPVTMTGDSVVSQQRAIRADLASHQYKWEDLLSKELAANGAGLGERIRDSAGGLRTQASIEKEVAMEMLRRGSRPDAVVPATNITRMADAQDELYAAALAEKQSAGVLGADAVAERSGFFPRKWDVTKLESLESALVAAGSTLKQAKQQVVDMLARGMQRANPTWTPELAGDIAHAVIARTRAKGYFEDAAFRRNIGNETAKEVREILAESGISNERLQRALDAITGQVDEAGKMATLKHRIEIDMRYGIQVPGGGTIRISDLIDTSLTRITEDYLDRAAANAAMARKGIVTASDLDKLRTDALASVPVLSDRAAAAKLFDDTVAAVRGEPVGEDMSTGMRKLQGVTQMVGLSSSGLWQVTETANIMSKYGMIKTVGYMIKTMPGFSTLLASTARDADVATQLHNVLSRNASQDIRIRPFLNKLEDNFDMPLGDAAGMSIMQAKQMVPYINGMKYIHGYQARLAANLITDTFSRAAGGNADALIALNKYGLESRTMDAIKADILAAGLDTAKWSAGTWEQVRGPLTKMMDDAVLRNRTGEIPAFAQFSQVGKFIFTFRSFVLGAHNKVLAGTLGREGFAGMGLLMAYQYPLTFLATAANQGIAGKEKTTEEIALMSLGQMGSIGLFGELAGVISGQKQQFGAPGLIPIDRMYKAASTLSQGNAGSAAAALLTATPILSIIPGTKALAETLKD